MDPTPVCQWSGASQMHQPPCCFQEKASKAQRVESMNPLFPCTQEESGDWGCSHISYRHFGDGQNQQWSIIFWISYPPSPIYYTFKRYHTLSLNMDRSEFWAHLKCNKWTVWKSSKFTSTRWRSSDGLVQRMPNWAACYLRLSCSPLKRWLTSETEDNSSEYNGTSIWQFWLKCYLIMTTGDYTGWVSTTEKSCQRKQPLILMTKWNKNFFFLIHKNLEPFCQNNFFQAQHISLDFAGNSKWEPVQKALSGVWRDG